MTVLTRFDRDGRDQLVSLQCDVCVPPVISCSSPALRKISICPSPAPPASRMMIVSAPGPVAVTVSVDVDALKVIGSNPA